MLLMIDNHDWRPRLSAVIRFDGSKPRRAGL